MKTAIITGITGQDGAYLAEFLIAKDYQVVGTYRPHVQPDLWRIKALGLLGHDRLLLQEADLTDLSGCINLIERVNPVEVYNLAAQSFVGAPFHQQIATTGVAAIGPLHLLEAIRMVNPAVRFYQASSSEMFGKAQSEPQTENTAFYPRSPYGTAKLFAHWSTINYRESFGIYAVSGILFNHESPLRGTEFVTRKITNGLAKIRQGNLDVLELGNLDAARDWGYARDYVEGMWRMMHVDKPDTYVLATNKTHTVRAFATMAARYAGFDLKWEGEGLSEQGVDRSSGRVMIRVNPEFYRPLEPYQLVGNPEKARQVLGWNPSTSLDALVKMMVEADIERNTVLLPS